MSDIPAKKRMPTFTPVPVPGGFRIDIEYFDYGDESIHNSSVKLANGHTAVFSVDSAKQYIADCVQLYRVAKIASEEGRAGDEVTISEFPPIWEPGSLNGLKKL